MTTEKQTPQPLVPANWKQVTTATREFMDLFVAGDGDERWLSVDDIDHDEMANKYDALSSALAATEGSAE